MSVLAFFLRRSLSLSADFVITGLGQFKWSWFRHPRPLSHLEIYDEASRGVWGSIALLWTLRLKYRFHLFPIAPAPKRWWLVTKIHSYQETRTKYWCCGNSPECCYGSFWVCRTFYAINCRGTSTNSTLISLFVLLCKVSKSSTSIPAIFPTQALSPQFQPHDIRCYTKMDSHSNFDLESILESSEPTQQIFQCRLTVPPETVTSQSTIRTATTANAEI